MGSVTIGIALIAGALAVLIYSRPRDGKIARTSVVPLLDTVAPLLITSGLALGCALVAAGLFL